jgi:hypothetical protein
MEFYKQCEMKRGAGTKIAYIPVQFAAVGKVLKISGSDGWTVTKVGRYRRSGQYLSDHDYTYRHHREVTDI